MTVASRGRIKIKDIEDLMFDLRIHEDEESFKALKDSLAKTGQVQPIVVRKVGDKYHLVAGSRRFRAVKENGEETIDAVVVEGPEISAFSFAMAENLHRKQLTPGEVLLAVKRASEHFNMSEQALLEELNISKTQIYVYLKLLATDKEIVDALIEEKISLNVAYEIAKVPSRLYRLRYLNFAVKDGATPELIRSWKQQEHDMINMEVARELGIEIPASVEKRVSQGEKEAKEGKEEKDVKVETNLYEDSFVCILDKGRYDNRKRRVLIVCEDCYNYILTQVGRE